MAGVIIFMGPTGAGKSAQAERLAAERGYAHLSSGDLLRSDPAEAAVLATGQLVPSPDVERLLGAALEAVPTDQAVVLDGFPRVLDEAKWLDAQLGGWQRTLEAVILFEVDEAMSARRLAARQRADDVPEAVAKKWREYNELTRPVVVYYHERGCLTIVDGNATVDEVWLELVKVLDA